MDYVFKAIGIAFIVSVVLFIFNALKMQHDSNRFSTSKDDSKKKENDKQINPKYQKGALMKIDYNKKVLIGVALVLYIFYKMMGG